MLQVRDLAVDVGGRRVVDGATFSLHPGDKVGLVGRNGAGKTSLLRVLGGVTEPHGGSVHRAAEVGYLAQDPGRVPGDSGPTALAHVLAGRGIDAAVARLDDLRRTVEADPSPRHVRRFADAEEAFRAAGGYAAESEVRRIVAGLGLADDRVDLPVDTLSGGERRRVELARILFAGRELLLLDEPTNHLDVDAKSWLMGFLRAHRGTLLVVSHDLALLDQAITRVLHLDEGEVVEYRGTYSQYRAARAADEVTRARVAARQEAEVRRLRAQADGMRGQTARRARVAKTLDRRRERLESDRVEVRRSERALRVRLPEPPRAGTTVLTATGLAKAYGAEPVFTGVDVDVGRGERLLVLGLNGAGKTTLLRIVAGEATADAGSVALGRGVSLGYYAQEHESIQPGIAAIDHIRGFSPDLTDQQRRDLLGMFGLRGDQAFQDAATFSGGEKTKLVLAGLVGGRHNLLLLDEPTNNLDPPSRTAVGEALRSWPGTMVLVSHDEEFVEALAPDRVLLMPDGTLDHWSDDLLDLVALA